MSDTVWHSTYSLLCLNLGVNSALPPPSHSAVDDVCCPFIKAYLRTRPRYAPNFTQDAILKFSCELPIILSKLPKIPKFEFFSMSCQKLLTIHGSEVTIAWRDAFLLIRVCLSLNTLSIGGGMPYTSFDQYGSSYSYSCLFHHKVLWYQSKDHFAKA